MSTARKIDCFIQKAVGQFTSTVEGMKNSSTTQIRVLVRKLKTGAIFLFKFESVIF